MAELVYLLVDVGILLYVGVSLRHVGLGLIVVVIGDEILHGVVGEEVPELRGKLGGEGLVVGDDEGRTLELLDDVGHGEGLAAAGDAHKSLGVKSLACAFHQAVDGLRLVSRRPEVGGYLEGPLFGADHGELMIPRAGGVCAYHVHLRRPLVSL